jgi:hypothetical protein
VTPKLGKSLVIEKPWDLTVDFYKAGLPLLLWKNISLLQLNIDERENLTSDAWRWKL